MISSPSSSISDRATEELSETRPGQYGHVQKIETTGFRPHKLKYCIHYYTHASESNYRPTIAVAARFSGDHRGSASPSGIWSIYVQLGIVPQQI